ncbi:DUF1488 family protein [Caballeronia glebae]|uniref:DUF1488 domain-containing protein n=1 Tax=Caballeronia glebae TaxID=1777143 RepID=UPI0038BA6FB9
MDIKFPPQAPEYIGEEPALMFLALVDDRGIECKISAEALEDHFGASSWREDDLQRAFENNRAVIEGAAEQLLTSVGCKPVILRSGYFRFSGGSPAAGIDSRHARMSKRERAAEAGNRGETDAQGGE